MIPSAIHRQLEQGLQDFLRFSFWSSTPGMENVVEHLLADDGMLFKGPYLSVKMPFLSGETPDVFPDVPLGFPPHHHQEQVFARLGGRRKQSTLLATGTGSGKTESFLLPILDHCLQTAHEPGVKAILIYPMNALASDQAARIARRIYDNHKLRGRVTAGLYVGDGGSGGKGKRRGSAHGETRMGADHVITDRATLQEAPPDILLTNYKMLDYLLLRPRDQRIWQHNVKGTLRFLVVDEIHTFDGAQGTDLACLLRRLKRRLDVDDGSLACIGTSATLGGEAAREQLRDYARKVFGEPFDADAIIGETRQSVEQFLHGCEIRYTEEPDAEDLERLDAAQAPDPHAWLAAQLALWFPADVAATIGADGEGELTGPESFERSVELGRQLRHHAAFHDLLRALDGQATTLDDAVHEMRRRRDAWHRDAQFARLAVLSLLGLVSEARAWRHELPEVAERRRAEGRPRPAAPLLEVRVQLWQRELRRLVANVGPQPHLRHSDDLDEEEQDRHLPMIHCRECGALGWGTVVERDRPYLYRCLPRRFYDAYFGRSSRVRFLFPANAWPADDRLQHSAFELDVKNLIKVDAEHADETLRVIEIFEAQSTASRQALVRDCPFCRARESLAIVGFRAATLTSVHIDQLFASRFNDDKKLLTFSDSVQDAAHRAGFFAARTWRTNLRIAMLQALEPLGETTLRELADGLGPWARQAHDEATFVATFLAPNMAWLHDWDALRRDGELPRASDLPDLIDQRLAFEVLTEFSLQAEIGRSLTRTGCAVADLRPGDVETAVAALVEVVRNEVPGLRQVEARRVEAFVLGLLQHLRLRGGILARSLPGAYIESCGKDVHAFSRQPALPGYKSSSRLPSFLTDRTGRRFDTWSRTGRGGESWYARWADACFLGGPGLVADAGSLYPVVLSALVRVGLLDERSASKGEQIWGLREEALVISPHSAALACHVCGHRTHASRALAERWHGVPCLRTGCAGVYRPDAAPAHDYFGHLYRSGHLQRIFAQEHTGLLERAERERIEIEFKAFEPSPELDDPEARRPWYPNLLSCTPTLEMGIDIGDLSSAILCSVPPGQASYLQRIGRAGRRDGNAFVLTVAAAKPHDLYFFAQPHEMIAGDVPPPGVFLDTGAVLERQLTAFCIDRWVGVEGDRAELPPQLRSVLNQGNQPDVERFPSNLLAFVKQERPRLLREFLEMFEDEIGPPTAAHLERFLLGAEAKAELDSEQPEKAQARDALHHIEATLESRLLDTLHKERKQREAHRANVETLRKQLKVLRATEARDKDHQEQIDEREAEKEALIGLIKAINQRSTLEFLTDQGLLPNYAFPESAVRLRSVIWRRKKHPPAQGSPYETWTYEYKRSPSSALAELAPGAEFYASGRRVGIDAVDLSSSKLETWRFCPECSHAESIDTGDAHTACPVCGAADWRDSGQTQRLLKLEQVFARESDRNSRIRDDRDERQPRFFERDILPTFDTRSSSRAWRLDDDRHPFGFEYCARVTFRDINFGEPSDLGARNTIAGRAMVRQGFELCARCGKVQATRKGEKTDHLLSCPSRRKDTDEQIESCVYLYRQLESEALRLLLPITDFAGTRQLNSFTAALQLGLESYFAGSVDHLRTTVYSEPTPDSTLRRQYLVLFDSVPGGTGFLKQLVTPDADATIPLFRALEASLQRIEGCACWGTTNRAGKLVEGCYRCLFGYRNSREMRDTSARTASEILRRILARADSVQEIERLGDISHSGLLDSALEARFLEALLRAGNEQHPAQLKRIPIGIKDAWLWTLGDAQWRIEPQVEPPRAETGGIGVSIDFVLRPASAATDRRLAIFLDGWQFHQDRLGQDLRQRQALLAAGWDVWTFTWDDLEAELTRSTEVEPAPELAALDLGDFKKALQQLGLTQFTDLPQQSTFRWLLQDLQDANGLPWRDLAAAALVPRLEATLPSQQRAWTEFARQAAPEALRDQLAATRPRALASGTWGEPRQIEWMAAHDGQRVTVLARLDDRELDDREDRRELPQMHRAWRGFLRLFQWLRAIDDIVFVTTSDVGDYSGIAQLRSLAEHGPEGEDAIWTQLDEIEDAYRGAAEAMIAAGIVEPVVGDDIPNQRDTVWSEAELVWHTARVALTSYADSAWAVGEPAADWRLFYLEDLALEPDGTVDVSPLAEVLAEALAEETE